MVSLLIAWLLSALGFLAAGAIVPGFRIKGFGSALVAAAIFGVLNALIGWLFFIVIGVLTLGLGFLLAFVTRLVVNTLLLKLTDALTSRLDIKGFAPAFWGALVISAVTTLGQLLLRA